MRKLVSFEIIEHTRSFFINSKQRWSRGHQARGQGQGHKKNLRPRPRAALPRTNPLEAEDRNARGQGQGPRTQAQVFSKKIFFRRSQKKVFKKILLVPELRSTGFYVQADADNLTVLVSGADMLWIRGMAHKAINIAASEQELQFSSKKTETVPFTHKRNPDLGSLSMNGLKLELSKEARLLGVILDSKLTWKSYITGITHKATTA